MGIQYYAFAVVALAASGNLQFFGNIYLIQIIVSSKKLLMIIIRTNLFFSICSQVLCGWAGQLYWSNNINDGLPYVRCMY